MQGRRACEERATDASAAAAAPEVPEADSQPEPEVAPSAALEPAPHRGGSSAIDGPSATDSEPEGDEEEDEDCLGPADADEELEEEEEEEEECYNDEFTTEFGPTTELDSGERLGEPDSREGPSDSAGAGPQNGAGRRPEVAAAGGPATQYNTVNDFWFKNYNGIIVVLPLVFNKFQEPLLERHYQRYSHGQRQKSLAIAHTVDLLLKLMLLLLPLINFAAHLLEAERQQWSPSEPPRQPPATTGANWSLNGSDHPMGGPQLGGNHSGETTAPDKSGPIGEALLFGPLLRLSKGAGQPYLSAISDAAGEMNQLSRWLWAASFALSLLARFLGQTEAGLLTGLFSSINLLAMGACMCLTQRKLTRHLRTMALLTWALLLAQSYLFYGSSWLDLRATLLPFAEGPVPVEVERQFLEAASPLTIWHTLLIIFLTYAMMPMPLSWCFVCSLVVSGADLVSTGSSAYRKQHRTGPLSGPVIPLNGSTSALPGSGAPAPEAEPEVSPPLLFPTAFSYSNSGFATVSLRIAYLLSQLLARAVIHLAINLVCLYTKYLIDLAQRNAFLETRRSIETRAKIERENDKQERLLLSLLPRFVALEIIADIAKEDNHERLLKNQFHKIYIHSYTNVR